MTSKQDALSLLRLFAYRKKSHILPFAEFVTFVERSAERKAGGPAAESPAGDTSALLAAALDDLAEEKRCALTYDQGRISAVVFPEFYSYLVKRRYKEIEDDGDLPFPVESALDAPIPSDAVTPVDMKQDFVQLLGRNTGGGSSVLRLNFPEGISSMVITSDMLPDDLLRAAVDRIRTYLNTQRNGHYMVSKLRGVFRSREQTLREMVTSVMTQRTQAVETIQHPTEFSFGFWTHLANAIIKEYREKANKLEREHNYCQAAYLLGYFSMHYKGIQQKEKDVAGAIRVLDKRLRQSPYCFTVSDIADFPDNQGLPLLRKYTRERMHRYLEEKTRPADDGHLPEILRLKTPNGKEYFICKELMLSLTVKKAQDASQEYRSHYIEKWMKAVERNRREPEMKSDEAFAASVDARLTEEDPLLRALLSFDLLFLLSEETKPSSEVSAEISRLLDLERKRIVPLDQALRLSRAELLSRAKMALPFWMTVPLLNRLMLFLRRFLSGQRLTRSRKKPGTKEETAGVKVLGSRRDGPQTQRTVPASAEEQSASPAGAQTAKARSIALQKAMHGVKRQLLGDAGLDGAMNELIEKWNPLFDPQAKANLVEDVNSLVRDFLRRLKRGFLVSPPDATRIRTMAKSLADNHAFDDIKRRDELRRYIELYMVRLLGGR